MPDKGRCPSRSTFRQPFPLTVSADVALVLSNLPLRPPHPAPSPFLSSHWLL